LADNGEGMHGIEFDWVNYWIKEEVSPTIRFDLSVLEVNLNQTVL
jgi:hypothetical protein